MPYGVSNCPSRPAGLTAHGGWPMPDRPDSPCTTRTTSAMPAVIAAAACRTCTRNEQPPMPVPSIQAGLIPR